MAHEVILGSDQMSKHGWSLNTNNHVMQWDSWLFAMSKESDSCEAALIDAGFLTPVLAKHRKVLGELSKLPAANLPMVKIEIAVFDASEEWVILEEENQAFLHLKLITAIMRTSGKPRRGNSQRSITEAWILKMRSSSTITVYSTLLHDPRLQLPATQGSCYHLPISWKSHVIFMSRLAMLD